MKNFIAIIFLCSVCCFSFAKRIAPKGVIPVKANGIIYTAPREKMGFIVAKDEKTGKILWNKQVYVVKYIQNLEDDVQDVFIKSVKLDKNTLIIKNEKNYTYFLDINSLKVTGALPVISKNDTINMIKEHYTKWLLSHKNINGVGIGLNVKSKVINKLKQCVNEMRDIPKPYREKDFSIHITFVKEDKKLVKKVSNYITGVNINFLIVGEIKFQSEK